MFEPRANDILNFTDHILATAAGNGAVILWNLNKITKQKQGTLNYVQASSQIIILLSTARVNKVARVNQVWQDGVT